MPLLPHVPISCQVIHVLVISHVCKSLFSSAEMETNEQKKKRTQSKYHLILLRSKKTWIFFMYKNNTETVKSKALSLLKELIVFEILGLYF